MFLVGHWLANLSGMISTGQFKSTCCMIQATMNLAHDRKFNLPSMGFLSLDVRAALFFFYIESIQKLPKFGDRKFTYNVHKIMKSRNPMTEEDYFFN